MIRGTLWVLWVGVGTSLFRCAQDEPPPPPPAPVGVGAAAATGKSPAGGTNVTDAIEITVSAQSTPSGATVTGGGRLLGTTPFTTRVPIPATPPGQPAPSFDFVFAKDGFQSATLQATPVNGQIAITAALAPQATDEDSDKTTPTESAGQGGPLEVTGRGGGAIRDHQVTTATATVDQPCVVEDLRVTVLGNHSYHQDLVVTLRSPSGQTYTLHRRRPNNPFRRHRVRRARGREAQGSWRLAVRDTLDQDTGRLTGFRLRLVCRGATDADG